MDSIFFISLPEESTRRIGDFELDPAVLLPVDVPEGAESLDLADLSWEMVLSAMLKVLAYSPEHEFAPYYRRFIGAVKPDMPDILLQSVWIKGDQKDFDLAEEAGLSLIGLAPERSDYRLTLAMLYERRSDHYRTLQNMEMELEYEKNAETAFKECFGMDDPVAEVYYFYGLFLTRRNRYEEASEQLKAYIDLIRKGGADSDPDESADRIGKAERILRECESLNLSSRLYRDAYDMIRAGQEQEGIEKIVEYLADHPSSWAGWFLLGWARRRQQQFEKAKEAFFKAIKAGSEDNGDLYNELAICEMELGQLPAAEEWLTKALRLEPENVKVISNLGILMLKKGDRDKALNYFETALVMEPDDPVAKHYINLITGQEL
jgi:tetratricopeptide (TPR) repeat protein